MKQLLIIGILCLQSIILPTVCRAELTRPGARFMDPASGIILAELEGSLEVACIRFQDGTVQVQFTISADPAEPLQTAEVTVLMPGQMLFNEAGYGIGRVRNPLALIDSNQLIIHGTRKLVACLDGELILEDLNPDTIPELVLNRLLEKKIPLGARQLVPLDFDLWAREGEHSAWRAVTDGSDDVTRLVVITRRRTPILLLHRFPLPLTGKVIPWPEDPALTLRRLTDDSGEVSLAQTWLRSLQPKE